MLMIRKLGVDEFLKVVEELTELYYRGIKRHGGTDLRLPESRRE